MSLTQRIAKNLGAMFTSNLVGMLITLAEPAIFVRSYGITPYADWIVLTTSVAALNNLDFGIQTFINQDLAVRFYRGERESYHVQQSTALRLLLGMLVILGLLCTSVFFFPIEHLLRLSTLTHRAAAISIYLVALQVLIGNLLFSYFAGNFMGVGLAHRGNYWNTAQRLTAAAAVYTCAWMRLPLPVLAAVQCGVYILCLIALLIDQRRTAPEITPSLRYWDGRSVKTMLKQSGYFGLIQSTTLWSFQLPVIVLQRFAGPAAVVGFTLMRKLFGFGRQFLNGMTHSMGPEITRFFGENDWTGMNRLYDYSERLVFALAATGNIAVLISSPLLLRLWLYRSHGTGSAASLFFLGPYILMCAVNIVLCLKEHKYQFQFCTNTHIELGRIMFASYIVMTALSFVIVPRFGLSGFLWTWLATESFQTIFIIQLNRKLFAAREAFSVAYVVKLCVFCGVLLAACGELLRYSLHWSDPAQIGLAAGVVLITAAASFAIFHLNRMSAQIRERFARLFAG